MDGIVNVESKRFLLKFSRFPICHNNKIYFPNNRHICVENWQSAVSNYYYTLALLALQFVIPLAVLIFTYTRIAIAVWGKRPPGEAENSRDQRMARSKRKVSYTSQKTEKKRYSIPLCATLMCSIL